MKIRKLLLGAVVTMTLATMVGCSNKDHESAYSGKVTLGKYKGIKVEKESTDPTNDEIDAQVKEYLHTLEDKDLKKVKDGDNVNIDFEGKIDGKKFDGGTSEKYNLVIGSNSFIDDFEEQLIGKKVGKKYDIKVTFPKTYQEESLAGKKATFTVKINYISPRKLTDKIVKKDKSNDYKTAKAYKKYVKKQLVEQKEATVENSIKSTILDKVVKNSKFKGIDKDVKKEVENSEEQIKKQYDLTIKEYAEQMGTDEDTLMKQIEESSETYVKQSLVLLCIADKENIKLKDKEFKKKVKEQLDEYASANYTVTEEDFYEQFGGKAATKEYYLQLKVLDYLVDKAKLVEPKEKKK